MYRVLVNDYFTFAMPSFPYGLVVRIPAFHAGGPGSIPGVGTCVFLVMVEKFEVVFHNTS